jgi:hypothetical protein
VTKQKKQQYCSLFLTDLLKVAVLYKVTFGTTANNHAICKTVFELVLLLYNVWSKQEMHATKCLLQKNDNDGFAFDVY